MFVETKFNPTIQKPAPDKSDPEITSSDETTPLLTSPNKTTFPPKCKNVLSIVTIEPMVFTQMFVINLVKIISQNLFIDRICRITLGMPDDVCRNLTQNVESDEITGDVKIEVDSLATMFLLYRSIIESFSQIIISLFLGSWSDKHGRKFLFLLCLSGHLATAGLNVLLTYLPDLPPEYLLLCSIPVALSGGYTVMILTSFSYIASATTTKERSARFAFLEICRYLGVPVGSFMGAVVYKSLGFTGVYFTEVGMLLVTLIYAIIRIRDDRPKNEYYGNRWTELFNISDLKETFSTVFKKRDCNKRMWILMLILAMGISALVRAGSAYCLFLFTRHMFGWNEQAHSMLNTVDGILTVVGILFMSVGGLKLLKLEDSMIGLIANSGCMASSLVIAFVPGISTASWLMYLAITFQMFGGMVSVPIRSMLSKCVPPDELGKIFTFVACAQTITPIFAGFIYSSIFISTEKEFPGAFSLLSAGLNFIVVSTFAYSYFIRKKINNLKNVC